MSFLLILSSIQKGFQTLVHFEVEIRKISWESGKEIVEPVSVLWALTLWS